MRAKWRRPAFRPQRALSLEDKGRLQLACNKTPAGKQLSILLAFLWTTWMRVCEDVRCELRDLDLENMTIGVVGKGNRFPTMALMAETASLPGGWLEYRRAGYAKAETRTVFINTRTGKPLTVEASRRTSSTWPKVRAFHSRRMTSGTERPPMPFERACRLEWYNCKADGVHSRCWRTTRQHWG